MSGKTYRRVMAVVSFLLLAVLAGLFVYDDNGRRPDNGAIQVVENTSPHAGGKVGGTFTLVNHKGEVSSSKDFQEQYKVVFFGFTSCPDICPAALQKVTMALDMMDEDVAAAIRPVFITVDPQRDTPEIIEAYLSNFHPRFTGFTGTDAEVRNVLERYRVYAEKAENGDGGEYLMDHSSSLYVMDENDVLVGTISAGASVEGVIAELDALQDHS